EIAERAAPACVASFRPRSRAVDQLLKFPIPERTEKNTRGLERIAGQLRFDLWINIAGDEKQIRVAVVVEVLHARAPADVARLDAEAAVGGHVLEGAFAVVVIEDVRVVGEVRFENIERAVKIVIADSKSHAGLFHAV